MFGRKFGRDGGRGDVAPDADLPAVVDLLMAASTCPGGDLSVPLWDPEAGREPVCNPIQVAVFSLDPAC